MVTPAAGKSGAATITLTVSDGELSAETSFVVTVNGAPTITSVARQTITEDGTTATLAFTVGDDLTAAASLVVTRASSNTTLFPLANVVLGGSGANRTVKVKPAANANGSATITLTVSDGVLKTSTSFVVTVTPVNDAPTLTVPASQVLAKDHTSAKLTFKVADIETAATKLVVTAKSSSTALFPTAGIVLGGSGTNRTVTLKPASGRTGSASITLTVSDGGLTASKSFKVTVANAPTIAAIANQTTAEDTTTGTIAVKLADADTATSKLTLTGKSSNATLLPASGFIFGGSGANRTLRLKPGKNANGSATVTLTVSDGSLTGTRSFKVTVTAVNDAPTISAIANQTVTKNSSSAAIGFTVADVETAATKLTVTRASANTTLLPLSGIVLGGNGANRTVKITPAKNRTGTAKITVTVSDGAKTASRSFTVTVNAPPTITAVANQTIAVNSRTAALAFKVADAETAASALKVTATSSNLTLVPAAGIALGGSGTNRTIRVTPTKAKTGTAKITFKVSDGAATATRSFTVTVTTSSGTSVARTAPASVPVDLPAITTSPVATAVRAGGAATFRVTAAGADLSYQWFRDGAAIAGATQATLAIASTTAADAGSYAVEVSNAAGSVRSEPVALAVVTLRSETLALGPTQVVARVALAVTGPADGWTVDLLLPAGWSYVDGSRLGAAYPAAGDRDLLEWAWPAAPAGPQTLVFVVGRPVGATVPATLDGLLTLTQGEVKTSVRVDVPLTPAR